MQDLIARKTTRRRVLQFAGWGALGVVFSACARALAPTAAPAPTVTPALEGVGAGKGAPVETPVASDQVMVTANANFYTVAYRDERPALPNDWQLSIGGNVTKPLTLTLADLKQMPAVEEMRTLECISNPAGGPLISNALWKGVKMEDLLERVGVKPDTMEIKLESFDGYHTSIPLDLALHAQSLLAYEMNGEPPPLEHGKPLRCLWPGRYGMKQPKWLTKITALAEKYRGYWEQQGWSNEARIKPNSRIDVPAELEKIQTARFEIKGIGFAGEEGIAKIEVSYDDGGTWHAAKLARGPTPYVWTNWAWNGDTPPDGQYTLLARVTDNAGRTQTREAISLLGGTFPDGTAAMAPVVITVKKG